MNSQYGNQPMQFGQPQYGAAAYPGFENQGMATMQAEKQGILSGLTRKPFLRFSRRRMNFAPILMCLFGPWVLFGVIYAVTSFSIHYQNPLAFNFVIIIGALIAVGTAATAVFQRLKLFSSPSERDPSWMVFLALTMILAWALGFVMGNNNYTQYMKPYFDFHNLNSYTDIYPNRMRGQQLMDAGEIQFAIGTHLDIQKSMGFKTGSVYCVAPITYGNETLQTYDFWAVGTNCCSGNQADFHCTGWNSPKARGGLRLMSGGSRGYYRLAVQQAESAYKIKAVHPLFFTWETDPIQLVEDWKTEARTQFLVWLFAHLLFQTFLVISAALIFSKLGHY